MIHSEQVEMERLLETEVSNIADGGRFKLANYSRRLTPAPEFTFTGWTYGTKVYHNVSRARVRLEGDQVHVVFGDGEKRREFDGNGRSEVNYPPGVDVVPVDEDEWTEMLAQHNPRQRQAAKLSGGANPMANVTELDPKVVKANQAKYAFAAKKLAVAATDADKDAAQSRLDKIEAAAAELGITPAMLRDVAPAAERPAAPAKVDLKAANAERVTTIRAKKAAAPAKAPREKKLDATANCLCGCGLETGGKFRSGHDASVKSMLYKVERGEIGFDDLPVDVKSLVKMAGKKSTAGKDDSDYRVVQSPVKFPGRDDVKIVGRDGKPVA